MFSPKRSKLINYNNIDDPDILSIIDKYYKDHKDEDHNHNDHNNEGHDYKDYEHEDYEHEDYKVFSKDEIELWLKKKSYYPNTKNIFIKGSDTHRGLIKHAEIYFDIKINICKGNKWVMLQKFEAKKLKLKFFIECDYCYNSKFPFIVHNNIEDSKAVLCPLCHIKGHIKYICTKCSFNFSC